MKKRKVLVVVLGCVVVLLLVILAHLYFSRYLYFSVPLRSMEPTIRQGSHIKAAKITDPHGTTFHYGDVVVFRDPRDPNSVFVQRITGLSCDTIEVRSKTVLRNEAALAEPYVKHERGGLLPPASEFGCLDNMGPVKVPEGHLWLMGDNRDMVMDSRYWGPIKFESILGRVTDVRP
jgi:signal peptidase I